MNLIVENNDDFNAIERYYMGKVPIESLTAHQMAKMDIWDYADNVLRSPRVNTERQAAMQISKKYNISLRTAQRDIIIAKKLHNSVSRIDKDYEKKKIISRLEWVMATAYNADPPKLKEYTRANAVLARILGIDKHDENAVPWELLQRHNYYIQFNLLNHNARIIDFMEAITLPGTQKDKLIDAIEQSTIIENPDVFLNPEGNSEPDED